jgi:ubiquinol-cytochrome c reductase cytochrome b subunit
MGIFLSAVVIWLDHRTGLPSWIKHFLSEDIPESVGWPQVFGSVALFLFALQALTGVLLAMNYAATPDDAYQSLSYIMHSVTAGRMVRGLHHWGASLMVIVVFLHMAQVFIFGAYRKPREATWMAGVCLLLLVLMFGLTGYLLPWDNRAYWGTVVTTRIIGSVPLIGGLFSKIVGFSGGIGVLTFSRFYATHTMILPAATVFLIIAHVALVRRHGVMPDKPQAPTSQKFYPRQALRDVVAVFIVFLGLFAAAVLVDAPLERIADATNTNYQPRPEWYFLFLFELLKLLPGSLELLGTVILPTLAVLALFALPFFPLSKFSTSDLRAFSAAFVVLIFGVWGGLTWATLRSGNEDQQLAIHGAKIYVSRGCVACHKANGVGGSLGPSLTGLKARRQRKWVEEHFVNPQRLSPGSRMPSYRFTNEDENAIISYLFSLP